MADLDHPTLRQDRVLLDLLADKWTILVLGSLCDHEGIRRFNAIKRDVSGISQRSLVSCLRKLERNGLVARKVIDGKILGVEYRLTELGYSLDAPVASLMQWTSEHAAAVRSAQRAFDLQDMR